MEGADGAGPDAWTVDVTTPVLPVPHAERLIAEPSLKYVPADRVCPRCHRGAKVDHAYDLEGVRVADPYCGYCGRNWPTDGGT